MSVETFAPTQSIRLTEAALAHFRLQLQQSGKQAVRISLKETGCNGLSYVVEGVDAKLDADLELPLGGDVRIYVESKALPALQGTEIDYAREGLNRALKFNNPNIKAECGCGESFTV